MEIRVLGLVEASHDGRALPLGGAKPRGLLAMLALHANTPVSADRLIEGLWGERPPATAPKLVQVLVSQLRKQLAGSDAEIVTRGRGYELRVDPDAVDALHFERLVTSGENGSHVREALALWRGPPLDDLADEPFAAPEIRRLEDLWLRAREAEIDAELAEGRHAAVLGELDDLVRAHPLRERLHGQRMLALYRCGRQAEALEAFRHARRVLLDEVGVEPGPELRGLNDAMLRQDPDLDRPAARSLPGRARRRSRWLLVAAGVAIAGAVALAVLQLSGSGGLDEVSEDATGVIDAGNGHIVAQYMVGHAPRALAAGGGSVWIANGRDGTVSRVERGHGQVTTIDVGGEPTAVAFGGGSLWVADGQNRVVDQVDSATNRVVGRVPAGNGSRGVAVAGGAVWLASPVDGQVERIDLGEGGPDPADRGARRARCHHRGQRRGVGGRRGGRRRDQARSCLGRAPSGRSGSATGRPRSRPGTAGSGSQTAMTGPSPGSTRPPTRSPTRCASAAARVRSPLGWGRSGWPTAARAP